MTMTCPCQSGQAYADCCQPLHQGMPAASPEALMRSRFSAFVLGQGGYIQQSWHPSTRPAPQGASASATTPWKRLQVLATSVEGDRGAVHFCATGCEHGDWFQLEEHSRFVREAGHWFYLDGDCQHRRLQPGRNDVCPCGSGRKLKKCCG